MHSEIRPCMGLFHRKIFIMKRVGSIVLYFSFMISNFSFYGYFSFDIQKVYDFDEQMIIFLRFGEKTERSAWMKRDKQENWETTDIFVKIDGKVLLTVGKVSH